MKLVPLSAIKEGEEVKIDCIRCGCGLRRRLCDLGLYDGTKVKVIKNDVGPVVLKVLDSKVVIGRGQAQKMLVEK